MFFSEQTIYGLDAAVDAGKGRGMDRLSVFFPTVVVRQIPYLGEIFYCESDAFAVSVEHRLVTDRSYIFAEQPQPGPITVDLKVRPLVDSQLSVKSVSGRQEFLGTKSSSGPPCCHHVFHPCPLRRHDGIHPRHEPLAGFELLLLEHCISDEAPVPQPRIAVCREIRGGDIRSRLMLILFDQGDAACSQIVHIPSSRSA